MIFSVYRLFNERFMKRFRANHDVVVKFLKVLFGLDSNMSFLNFRTKFHDNTLHTFISVPIADCVPWCFDTILFQNLIDFPTVLNRKLYVEVVD